MKVSYPVSELRLTFDPVTGEFKAGQVQRFIKLEDFGQPHSCNPRPWQRLQARDLRPILQELLAGSA